MARRSRRYILTVWIAASMVTPLSAIIGSLLFGSASGQATGMLEAASGGILLGMAVESMIPEAFDRNPLFGGALSGLGFAVVAALAALVMG